MTAVQSAQYTALTSFLIVVADNDALTQLIPAFYRQTQSLRSLMAQTKTAEAQSKENTTGLTQDKLAVKAQLFDSMNKLATLASAYAAETNNVILANRVKKFAAAFGDVRQNDIAALCQDVLDKTQLHLVGLADYGVTSETFSTCQTLIDTYEEKVPAARSQTKWKKVNTQARADLFEQMMDLMNNRILKTAVAFQTTHPAFYNQLIAAATVATPSVSHTQVKIKIDNTSNKHTANMLMVRLANSDVHHKANEKGEITIRLSKSGRQDIEVFPEGGDPILVQGIVAKKGKTTRITLSI